MKKANSDRSVCPDKDFLSVNDVNFDKSNPHYKECFLDWFKNQDDFYRVYTKYTDDDGYISPYRVICDDNFDNDTCIKSLGLRRETKILGKLIDTIINQDFKNLKIEGNNLINYFNKINQNIREIIIEDFQNNLLEFRQIDSEYMFLLLINSHTELTSQNKMILYKCWWTIHNTIFYSKIMSTNYLYYIVMKLSNSCFVIYFKNSLCWHFHKILQEYKYEFRDFLQS